MNTLNITPYAPAASAQDANLALKQAVKCMDQARHCAVLWFKEIVSRKLFQELGYSSAYQYAATELGFSSTRCGDFLMLARKLDELPQLKSAMEEGKIGYTKAREVIKVASPQSEGLWIETAKKQSRQELRRQVDRARLETKNRRQENPDQGQLVEPPKRSTPAVATAHRINVEMTSEQMARYEALWEKIHKTGGVQAGSDKAEVLLSGMAALVENKSEGVPSGPMVQIHVRQCPDCEKSSLSTTQGEVALTPEELERLSCDARIDRKGQKNQATIAPVTRRRVLARDHHRCQGPGCKHTRFLEVHHRKPRSQGGGNEMENLITLCGACHRRVHERGWTPGVADAGSEMYRWSAVCWDLQAQGSSSKGWHKGQQKSE